MCVLPNEERVKRFSSEMGGLKHVYCVWNCPVLKEVNLKQRSDEKGSLMVLYHGSIVPFRLPLAILQALKMLPREVKLRVIGYETVGSVGYVTQMKELASRLQISDRIEFIGPMPRHKLMEFSKTCEVGLALMPKQAKDLNIECMLGASNKPFDYLACGLALLVSDLPDWEKIYVEPGYGLACDPDDPESVATALKWFLDHPQEMRAMGEKGRNRIISEWNYEKQFLLVLGCMEKSTVF
jgi:glycosyltransferase involved in cell wall biosynthesis